MLNEQSTIESKGKESNGEELPDSPPMGDVTKVLQKTLNGTPRERGTNPRAVGSNPRALGTNPRALETNPKARRKPRTAVPDEFTPNDADYAEGKKLGFGQIEVMRAVPGFVLFWKGDGRLKADWHATFQNRLHWLAEHKSAGTVGAKNPLAKIGKPNPLVGSPEWRAANGMDPEAE